jgi:hypothetical protein
MEPEEWRTTGPEIGSWVLPHKQAGAQHSQSPVIAKVRTGDGASMRPGDLKRELIRARTNRLGGRNHQPLAAHARRLRQ